VRLSGATKANSNRPGDMIRTMSIASCRSGFRKNKCSQPSMNRAEARRASSTAGGGAFCERAALDAGEVNVEEDAARLFSFAFIDIIDESSSF
jgi:hypothetical protein